MCVGGLTECLPHLRHSLHGNEGEDNVCANKSHVNAKMIIIIIGIIAPNMHELI